MMRDGRMHYGLFDEFAGGHSLLFAGSHNNMQRFAAVLRETTADATADRLPLNDTTLFRPSVSTDVVIEFNEHCESCIKEVKRLNGKSVVIWSLSRLGAMESATSIDALAHHGGPGHQYLETTGDVQIIVSVDEYDESIFNGS